MGPSSPALRPSLLPSHWFRCWIGSAMKRLTPPLPHHLMFRSASLPVRWVLLKRTMPGWQSLAPGLLLKYPAVSGPLELLAL